MPGTLAAALEAQAEMHDAAFAVTAPANAIAEEVVKVRARAPRVERQRVHTHSRANADTARVLRGSAMGTSKSSHPRVHSNVRRARD